MAAESTSRTLVLSVVAVDMVGYSRVSVAEQKSLKDNFNQALLRAIRHLSAADRIILDTGDGAAMGFLGDPEDALYVAMFLHQALNLGSPGVRIGINLGPVKLATGVGGHPNIIGDGINVAERIMTFADPGQLTVSRPFFDMMSRVSGQYKNLFEHIGVRTDKQVRDHDVYLVSKSAGAFELAEKGVKERASQRIDKDTLAASAAVVKAPPKASATSTSAKTKSDSGLIDFLEDGKKVATTATLLAVVAVGLGATLVYRKSNAPTEASMPVVAASSTTATDPEGGAATPVSPPGIAVSGNKSGTTSTAPIKAEPKSAPAVANAPLPATKSAPVPAAPAPAAKTTPVPVAPAPVAKTTPAPVTPAPSKATPLPVMPAPASAPAPAPAPARELPKDAKTETAERTEKSPTGRPVRDEIRKALQARIEREQSAPAPATPVVPSLQSPVQAPQPGAVAPTPSLPPPVARPDTSTVIMERREPAYPVEGIRQGILRIVVVKARVTIGANGGVTDVVILEGGPIAAFGRQTSNTLREWKFNPGAAGRKLDVEVTFKP